MLNQQEVNPYGNLEEESGEGKPENMGIQKQKTPLEKFDALPQNTLDQPICDSLITQIKSVCIKFSYVLIPCRTEDGAKKLNNWDLWGPFFLCLLLAIFIESTFSLLSSDSQHFLAVIFSVFLGGIVVSFNLKVLGGETSFFQSVSVLGYCILPLFIALLIVEFLKIFGVKNQLVVILIVAASVIWCVFGKNSQIQEAAKAFVGINVPQNRRFVALYPIILFYTFLGVMLVYHR